MEEPNAEFRDVQDDSRGWYVDVDGDHFDPLLIQGKRGGNVVYDGAVRGTILGPFDSEAEAIDYAKPWD